jgi:hypothetical protein
MKKITTTENLELYKFTPNFSWQYYNHALLPTTAPHEEADVAALGNPETWKPKGGGHPLFARWTSHFDCGYETGWYHCILDKPFDISALKSKKRHQINLGIQNFDVRIINPNIYAEQIHNVFLSAWQTYTGTGKLSVNKNTYCSNVKNWQGIVFGAFLKNKDELVAWMRVHRNAMYIDMISSKTIPEFERLHVNASLVYGVCEYFKDDLANGKYLCNGERNIYHPTNRQAYLEKYFGFRKAYSLLHLHYAPYIRPFIRILYPFRKILRCLPFNFTKQISGVLQMEEIVRKQNKKYGD